mmetsp:Transcript_6691/g.9787  ORF Transcript_6691/g.9787 Transcript_6691/m.9787 type:complete len:81 (+) Transcript_6691:2091-2333(+)
MGIDDIQSLRCSLSLSLRFRGFYARNVKRRVLVSLGSTAIQSFVNLNNAQSRDKVLCDISFFVMKFGLLFVSVSLSLVSL